MSLLLLSSAKWVTKVTVKSIFPPKNTLTYYWLLIMAKKEDSLTEWDEYRMNKKCVLEINVYK